ncbi:unnamed protein product [Parnassius apollo]|uniref:(apollo) hypothetical protein n=1 Tax=Parnassius apollo TaxID=110799 RepID=A0A8S3X5I3_PARAO|nr:unnamed protein product [Parnassius apollo]
MPNTNSECDLSVVLSAVVVFGLPLALLIPNFSIWDVMPKIRVHRFHILSQHLSWMQINVAIIALAALLFCFYLEIRKRILDDMVEEVLAVRHATLTTVGKENERQEATMKACVELLDASADHYENLVLLHDELRKHDKTRLQHPPTTGPESGSM